MINHEAHEGHEGWRRDSGAESFAGRSLVPRCACLGCCTSKGSFRHSRLCMRACDAVWDSPTNRLLGYIFGSTFLVHQYSGWPLQNVTEPFPKVGCLEPVDQACLKRPERGSTRRQAKPDWNGEPSHRSYHPSPRQLSCISCVSLTSLYTAIAFTVRQRKPLFSWLKEIRKIAASFLLAMTTVLRLTPSATAMGNKNSRHREERSDLHSLINPKASCKLAGHWLHSRRTESIQNLIHSCFVTFVSFVVNKKHPYLEPKQ